MEPEIKSSFDGGAKERKRRRRNNHLDYLWIFPLYLLQQTIKFLVKYPYVLLALVIAIAAVVLYNKLGRNAEMKIEETEHIGVTANQIQSIKDVGQWEALSIESEEMVDTTEKHLLGDKQMIRIYTGTMRLGVDLKEAQANWFVPRNDTAIVELPSVKLLNKEFIDKARTRTFYEKGSWNENVNEALYQKAAKRMQARNITIEQLNEARDNIREQFRSLFESFGYKVVMITFAARPNKTNNAKNKDTKI